MNTDWSWVGRYVAVIVIALVLGAALGNMDLFETTTVIGKKLTASHLVRFLGYCTALAAFWMLAQRATIALQKHGGRWTFLQHLILPAVSLIVVASAYSVLLLVLGPMLDASLHSIYNWVFIAGIVASAGWLVMAVLNQSSPLTEAFTSAAGRLTSTGKSRSCQECGTRCEAAARYCHQCGKALTG